MGSLTSFRLPFRQTNSQPSRATGAAWPYACFTLMPGRRPGASLSLTPTQDDNRTHPKNSPHRMGPPKLKLPRPNFADAVSNVTHSLVF